MQAFICTVCGFLYDEESADIGPDGKQILFEELDLEWGCPICGAKAEVFNPTDSERTKDITSEER